MSGMRFTPKGYGGRRRNPDEVKRDGWHEQRVLAVHLDARNKVEKIANYGLQDGRLFDFISRTTPTGGEELSLARQLIKSTNLAPPGIGG